MTFGPFIQRIGLTVHKPSRTKKSPNPRAVLSVPYTVDFARKLVRLAM